MSSAAWTRCSGMPLNARAWIRLAGAVRCGTLSPMDAADCGTRRDDALTTSHPDRAFAPGGAALDLAQDHHRGPERQ